MKRTCARRPRDGPPPLPAVFRDHLLLDQLPIASYSSVGEEHAFDPMDIARFLARTALPLAELPAVAAVLRQVWNGGGGGAGAGEGVPHVCKRGSLSDSPRTHWHPFMKPFF